MIDYTGTLALTGVLPRVYPIIDTGALARRGRGPLWFAEALIEGGARLLQLRHKEQYSRAMFDMAREVAELCARAGVRLIVDDRADIAALLDAGLHLGQRDLPPSLARRVLGPERLLGLSTHNEEQLRSALDEPADYVAVGPVFPTLSKDNADPALGIEALSRLRALTAKPLVAIGGITPAAARAVLLSGIDTIAVIGGLLPDEMTKASVRERMEEWIALTR